MGDNEDGTCPTSKRGFHISHLNLQSINNKTDLLKIQIEQMRFHVFTFSESWLHAGVPDNMLRVNGYNLVRFDRKWKEDNMPHVKKGGGVGMYIKEELAYSFDSLKEFNMSSKDIECGWVKIIMQNSKDIVIGVVYRPPNGDVENFCEKLITSCDDIGVNHTKDIFLMGDFNINYLAVNERHKKLLTNMESLTGLKQLITQPTRMTNCIDLIFTNCNEIANSGVLDIDISDHDLVFVTKKKATITREQIDFYGRSYKNYDKNDFQLHLINHNWETFWGFDDPTHCWEYITTLIESYMNVSCPIKRRRVKNSSEPWLNNEILEAIFDKDQAWKEAKVTKNIEDIREAKRLRNWVKDIIRRAKRDYIQEEIDNNEHSTRKFWEKLNYVLPTKDKENTIRLIDKESGEVVEEDSLPGYINRFFTEIGPSLARRFTNEWQNNYPEFMGDRIVNVEVDLLMMEKVVKDININKSSSVPNLSSRILKDAFTVMLPQLVFMYNLSFITGLFPDMWKIANVIPLKKGGGPH